MKQLIDRARLARRHQRVALGQRLFDGGYDARGNLPALLDENPRYVFFRELTLDSSTPIDGPIGALGVPLSAGRAIAVDPGSIDLTRFERLRQQARAQPPAERVETLRRALALWRGRALADLRYEPCFEIEAALRDEVDVSSFGQS